MKKAKDIDIQVGDIVEVAGSRGHVLSAPAPLVEGAVDDQRFILVYFFTGQAATAQCAVNVLVNEKVRVVKRRDDLQRDEFRQRKAAI